MKARRTTATVFAVAWSLALGACGSSQEEPDVPEYPTQPPATYTAPPAYTGVPQPTYSPPPVVAPPPPTEQQCRGQAATPVAVDLSAETDVRQQYGKFFAAHHEIFRCCFDALESPSKPRVNAKVSLLVKVDENGKLTGAEIIPAETSPIYPQTAKCITDIAAMVTYPKPVGGKPVNYVRAFDFKARW